MLSKPFLLKLNMNADKESKDLGPILLNEVSNQASLEMRHYVTELSSKRTQRFRTPQLHHDLRLLPELKDFPTRKWKGLRAKTKMVMHHVQKGCVQKRPCAKGPCTKGHRWIATYAYNNSVTQCLCLYWQEAPLSRGEGAHTVHSWSENRAVTILPWTQSHPCGRSGPGHKDLGLGPWPGKACNH